MQIEKTSDDAWRVDQVLVDPEGHNDWLARFTLDLARSREENRPILALESISAL
jgi:hypothetical protein